MVTQDGGGGGGISPSGEILWSFRTCKSQLPASNLQLTNPLTLMPPIRCSPLNSLPFFSQWMVGVGLPDAAQRNLTVLAAGMAKSFLSIRSGLVQYGAPVGETQNRMGLYCSPTVPLGCGHGSAHVPLFSFVSTFIPMGLSFVLVLSVLVRPKIKAFFGGTTKTCLFFYLVPKRWRSRES